MIYTSTLRREALLSFIAMCILFIGAIVFYKERLFADTSFIAFNIINYNSLSIPNQRYGAFITQVVPYLALKLHLPLRMILLSYAISFNLFFLTVSGLLVYKYKQYMLAILMSFYYLLFVSDSYFLANDEIHQAVAWMFLMFGTTLYYGNKGAAISKVLIYFIPLAILTLFTHFIVIIPTCFIWVYLIIERKNWPFSRRHTILLSLLLIIIIIIKFWLSSTSQQYEKEHLAHLTNLSPDTVVNSFTTPVISMFLFRLRNTYWIAIGVFITGMVSLITSRQIMLFVWALLSCTGYFILMGVVYGELDKDVLLFHIETEWLSLAILIAMPFVFAFLPKIRPSVSIGLLAAIFLMRIAYISSSAPAFIWRTDFHKKVLAQMRKKNIYKLALYDNDTLFHKYMLNWAGGYETLFESALENDVPQRNFIIFNKDDKQKQDAILSSRKGLFLFDMTTAFNSDHFIIDTTQFYHIMTVDEFFRQ